MSLKRIRRVGVQPTPGEIVFTLAEVTAKLEKWKQAHLRLLGTVQKYQPEPGSDGARHLAATLDGWNKRVISDAISLATTLAAYADMMKG